MRASIALIFVALAVSLASCATANARDWAAGADAKPFDQAASECSGQRAIAPDPKVGEATFALCMGQKGWTHR